MNNVWFLLLIVLVTFSGCQGQSGLKRLQVENFETTMKAAPEKIILDVRTQQEFANGHLQDAVLIDYYSRDFKSQVQQLDKTKPVFVYCASGIRSHSAAKTLTDLGFKEVYDLQGGINAWWGAKKPVVR